jgi:hypothetical protein
MNLADPLHVPIRRNRKTGNQIELCVPALIKWVAGILAVLVPAGIAGTLAMMFSVTESQARAQQLDMEMVRRLDRMEAKMDRTFTERDADRLEARIMNEIDRRHGIR